MPGQHNESHLSRNIALLIFGQLVTGTSAVLLKLNTIHPFLLAGYRLVIASIVLLPLFLRDLKRSGQPFTFSRISQSIVPGILLAIHWMTWTIAARRTLAANMGLLVNLLPLIMPFVIYATTREVIRRHEVLGSIIALIGIAFLGITGATVGSDTWVGDLIGLGSAVFYAVYLALARRSRAEGSIWIYVVPLYLTAGVVALAAGLLVASPLRQSYDAVGVLSLAGLIVGPTIIGHSVANHSMRVLSPQLVALSQFFQIVSAGVLGYFLLAEVPPAGFYVAVAFVIAGVVVVVRGNRAAASRR